MSSSNRDSATLLHAAELLEREARYLYDSMTAVGEWDDDDVKYDHDDMLATAARLRKMAG